MKFTLALPLLWAAATAGPASADTLRNLNKASKIEDNAAFLNRRVQEDVEDVAVAEMKDEESCAEESLQAGLQMLMLSNSLARMIFSSNLVELPFGVPLEPAPTSEVAATFSPPLKVTKEDLKSALDDFKSLGILMGIVRDAEGAAGEEVGLYWFAQEINKWFAEMDCKEFEDFLEKGQELRQLVFGPGCPGGPGGPGCGGPIFYVRRIQEVVEGDVGVAEMKVKDEQSCAEEFLQVGVLMLVLSRGLASMIFSEFYVELPGLTSIDWVKTIKKGDLRSALNKYPSLSIFAGAIEGEAEDFIDEYGYAQALNALLADMDCKEFEAFLEEGQLFGGPGFGPGSGPGFGPFTKAAAGFLGYNGGNDGNSTVGQDKSD